MGGTPLLALSIAAFPEELPVEMLAAIFAAADAQVRAAGGLLAGGHTIRDAEPKYGLAVVGTVRPDGIWPKNGAQPGDTIFLTKPLGTGLIMTGYKKGHAGDMQLERAIRWMCSATIRRQRVACSSRYLPIVAPPSRPSSRVESSSFVGSAAWRRVPESSSSESRDDSRALPALPQRTPGVPTRGGCPFGRRVRRDHEPRSAAHQGGAKRSAAPSPGIEPLHVRRAVADGQRRRPRRGNPRPRDPVPGQRARALARLRSPRRDAIPEALLRLGRHQARA